MKHDIIPTLFLIILFLGAHIIGLFIVKNYLPVEGELPLGIQRPEVEEETSYLPLITALLIATALALILIKFRAVRIWKTWFFLSVAIALLIAFAAFLPQIVALILALIFSALKTFRPAVITHNFTELFIYGGLAGLFVPILGVSSIIILLILVSVYDMVAVWKTKHMISMAKFQAKSKMFAGLMIPYKPSHLGKYEAAAVSSEGKPKYREAVLGGGDIAFPLLFSGVMLKNFGFLPALITSFTAAIALFLLLFFADKKKFYPAMPFITAGSLIGYFIVWLSF